MCAVQAREMQSGKTVKWMNDETIKINVEAEGIEETTEQLEALAGVYDGFPAQVTIKNCRDCTINIYPTQIRQDHGGDNE